MMKIVLVVYLLAVFTLANAFEGVFRSKCANRNSALIPQLTVQRQRLNALRNEMRIRASVQGPEIDAYIVTSYDEHQSDDVADADQRRRFITGFNGSSGDAAITLRSAALWTDPRFIDQANAELECEWTLFQGGIHPSLPIWLASQLPSQSRVGADPKLVPHVLWQEWEAELARKFIKLVPVNRNLIDSIWGEQRPPPALSLVKVHQVKYAGEKWESKVAKVRFNMSALRCDAMVVTSLPEIAYLLNLRGNDIPFVPVFKAYLLITHAEIILYSNLTKFGIGSYMHLKSRPCNNANCVRLKNYTEVWSDLRTYAQQWRRILLPSHCVYDMGVSEAVFSTFSRDSIVERISPIIYMKAQKNEVEREGMRRAHVRDAAAMCEFLSYYEERFLAGDHWTEMSVAKELDRSRRAQDLNQGLSFKTVVAFGSHGAMQHYLVTNASDAEITEHSTLVVDSGGQYLDGTTDVARTFHFGEPSDEEKKAYTSVLAGMIRLSMLVFPETLRPGDVDVLPRGAVWGSHQDYPSGTGHGIGSFLSLYESPINVAYTAKQKFTFKDGYFFSNAPGIYKAGQFGAKLKNVLEVMDTGKIHPTGVRFLTFRDTTLVPFEPKLIDRSLLSSQEKRWLNDYNARIREFVGEELKKQTQMNAFHWMMNKTGHVIEYLAASDYRKNEAEVNGSNGMFATAVALICLIFAF